MSCPNPENDKECTPVEFCNMSLKICSNGSDKTRFIDHYAQHRLVPIKQPMPCELLSMDAENAPSEWHRCLARKCSLEVDKVAKKVLDDLDANVSMTTADTEASGTLNDETKH